MLVGFSIYTLVHLGPAVLLMLILVFTVVMR